ncbi:MAG: helix-turn-helix transcriptional regulator [Methanobrevibacter sp.]|nr:helix-turn-helix transcriptional regulator [Methanobrevibacter sp.]
MGKLNESKVDYWLTDDGLLLIEAWTRDGITLEDLSSKMGITRQTLNGWKNTYPEIKKAMSVGKELIDYKVENALLKAALGFTTKEIKVTIGKKPFNGEMFELLKETTTKEVAPNVTACMAWLNNRKHEQWKRNRDKTIDVDPEEQGITISIVRGPKEDQLGTNVNQEVKFEKEKPRKQLVEKNVEVEEEEYDEDMSCWDDWDGEE